MGFVIVRCVYYIGRYGFFTFLLRVIFSPLPQISTTCEEFKKKVRVCLSILPGSGDYRMKDAARKAVLLAPPGEKTVIGGVMARYLVAIHHPDDYDASLEDAAMERDIDVLNDEMVAAGVRIFVGGLRPASSAKSVRAQPDGKVLVTDGPYLETKEHIGGFWVVEAADMNQALGRGRKAPVACRAPVEVRPFG